MKRAFVLQEQETQAGSCKLAAINLTAMSANFNCQAALLVHSGQRSAHTAHTARSAEAASGMPRVPSLQLPAQRDTQSKHASSGATRCDVPEASEEASEEASNEARKAAKVQPHMCPVSSEYCASQNKESAQESQKILEASSSRDSSLAPDGSSSKPQESGALSQTGGGSDPDHLGVVQKLTAWGATAASAAEHRLEVAKDSDAAAARALRQHQMITETVAFWSECAQAHRERLTCVGEAVRLLESYIACMHEREGTHKQVRACMCAVVRPGEVLHAVLFMCTCMSYRCF